jgi:aminobenzoyl-glutamate utilization protein B
VAYHAPLIDGAPGHGEGHNAGQAVNVTAAIALKRMMEKHHIPGTLRLYPGVAEELLAGKNYMVRAGLFKEVEALLGAHISDGFSSPYGLAYLALISAQFTFHGQTAHAANAPWSGRSALDAVELMDVGWNFRREHLRPEQRSHCVITDGGDQPNVVPDHAAIWYYFRETDFTRVQALHQIAQKIAQGAAMMTETQMSERVLSGTWSCHFNRVLAETQLQHMRQVGIPAWSEADQALAKALQKELGSEAKGLKTEVETFVPGKTPSGSGSDDIGDLSWNLPTCYLRFPGNISGLPGHSWANGVSMATPIAHKGATAGAKVQALTALDLLLQPELRKAVGAYFQEQTRETQWASLVPENSHPPIEMNQSTMEKFRPQLGKLRFDPDRYDTYLEQLGVRYPSLHQ